MRKARELQHTEKNERLFDPSETAHDGWVIEQITEDVIFVGTWSFVIVFLKQWY